MIKVRIERKADWTLRPAGPENRSIIEEFYKENTWKGKDAYGLYDWKFVKNPQGETLIIAARNTGDKVVSSCAFMPWKLWMNGNVIKASQWVDMIIELAYRGQSIPAKSLEEGRSTFRNQDAHICFAFPNQNGVLVHKQNNGMHLGCILRYTKPLRSNYIIDRFVKIKLLSGLLGFLADIILTISSKETRALNLKRNKVENIVNSIDDLENFWKRFSDKCRDKIMTRRDGKYLNWKSLNTPNKYRKLYALKRDNLIHGYVVLESVANIGYIVDILACDLDALDCLIGYSIKYFRRQRKDSIVFVALENNMYFKEMEKFGFIKRPEEKHFYFYMDEGVKNKDFFMDSRNWFITIGDCDIERL